MHITMVKKQLVSGEPCEKCAQAEEMLRRRSLWDRIDQVIWAVEGDDGSPGARVAAKHGVELAPFFVVQDDGGRETVVTSALRLVKQHLGAAGASEAPTVSPVPPPTVDARGLARYVEAALPSDSRRFGLDRYGDRCAIAFSGAEEVVLIYMATRLGLPFSVFSLDTGRLQGETYEFLDDLRRRYGVEIDVVLPDAAEVADLVQSKGSNSFYRDGHWECCAIRKLRPLRRVLGRFDAWVTGKRRGGESSIELPVAQADPTFQGANGDLLRLNPLASWSRVDVLDYARRHAVPTHPLHEKGFARIGCVPCTRPRSESPDEPDRWWWEQASAAPAPADPGSGI
jgi:phosphoadenosine phosphosulfate reductase